MKDVPLGRTLMMIYIYIYIKLHLFSMVLIFYNSRPTCRKCIIRPMCGVNLLVVVDPSRSVLIIIIIIVVVVVVGFYDTF